MKAQRMLMVDAVINLVLGLPLLFFPKGTAELLRIPIPEIGFYASILGAVLTGIGLALLLESYPGRLKVTGLGLGGAIAINLLGGGALAIWSLSGALALSPQGYVFWGWLRLPCLVSAWLKWRICSPGIGAENG